MINFVKKFFNTDVVFSGRPAIHVHDIANDRILDAHQETNQFARDTMYFGFHYLTQTKILAV